MKKFSAIQLIDQMYKSLAKWIQPQNTSVYKLSLQEWLIYHHKEIALKQVSWMGVKALKNVLDLWIYQEILWEIQPEIIIEIGSLEGGSTLYLAHLLDIMGKGQVISIDIDRQRYRISHRRIIALTGDSQAEEIVAQVAKLTAGKSGLVIHDGNHEKDHVLKDLELYAPFVSPGSYFIVEDGIVDVLDMKFACCEHGGPLKAVESFLVQNHNFEIDTTRERYLLTYNPKGYLKRIN